MRGSGWVTRGSWLLLWLLGALSFIYLASISLTLSQQMWLAWSLVVGLMVMKRVSWFKQDVGRVIILLVAAFISLRYMWWRSTDTLVYSATLDFVLMTLVFLAEVEVTLVYFMNLFANVQPLQRPLLPLPEDSSVWPSVDVFIPTYTEPEEIVKITATACTQLNYPKDKLRIYILDDGSSQARREHPDTCSAATHRHQQLQQLAQQLGIGYVTRPTNAHAKAGNINEALTCTHGDLILMLDCDHVPTQDFLQNTVAWFLQDEKLFLIQTPHFFINPDPVEKGLGTFHRAPSENEMFYRSIHPAIDFWNASYFCGSAALLRRRCLEEVGGLSRLTVTEDAQTALLLHAKGYRSIYINRPMVCGLSPETFSDMMGQRSRWCQGMLQMGLLSNPLTLPGLTWAQRICYSSCYLFWFFGFARFVFSLAPTLFLLFGLQIYHASSLQVLVYAVPHLAACFLITDFLFGRYRWPLFSELYEGVQSIFLLPAVLGVIRNPRSPRFKLTPKGEHLSHDFLSPLAMPFYGMLVVMLLAIPAGIYRWFAYPLFQDVILICGAWLLLNLIMALASLGIFWERHQVRHFHRAWASGEVAVHALGQEVVGDLEDLSLTGIGLCATLPVAVNDSAWVTLTDSYGRDYRLAVTVMRMQQRGHRYYYGCAFVDAEQQFAQLVQLVYGDSQCWVDFWERGDQHPSLLRVLVDLLRLGGKGIGHSYHGLRDFAQQLINHYRRRMALVSTKEE